MENANCFEIAAETMLGDLMSLVVDELKAAPDAWQKMSERKQSDVLYRVENRCRDAVEKCVDIIAAQGNVFVNAVVSQVVFKEGVKIELKTPVITEATHELAECAGKVVKIVILDQGEFTENEAGKPKAEPDQADAFPALESM